MIFTIIDDPENDKVTTEEQREAVKHWFNKIPLERRPTMGMLYEHDQDPYLVGIEAKLSRLDDTEFVIKETHASYCLGFVFYGQSVLLIRKTSPEWQKGKLNGIGGKLEVGEEPAWAMVRECREEINLETCYDEWQYKLKLIGRSRDTGGLFSVHVFSLQLTGPQDASRLGYIRTTEVPGKEIEPIYWLNSRNLPGWQIKNSLEVIPNLHWIIPMIQDNEVGTDYDVITGNYLR